MREIKFRAWNKRDKVMEYDVNVNQGKPVKQGCQWFNTENTETVYHSALQQYTGLKDKNGKEIYEGDIVRGKYGKNGIVKNYEIRWLIGHFAAVDRNNITGDEHYYPIGLLEGEVIGNIYENPELLEVEKHD